MSERELTKAEAARALAEAKRFGVLCTSYYKAAGQPYGSTATYALDELGRPIFLLASIAAHSRGIEEDPRASLVIWDASMEDEPLDNLRMTLIGTVKRVDEDSRDRAANLYLERFPEARDFLELDFDFYRMEIAEIHWIGGFGGAGWPSVSDYAQAPKK